MYTGPGFRVHSDIVARYILHYGNEAQKQHWLPRWPAAKWSARSP